VAKTRLQLQGELAKEGGEKVYKHVLDVFSKTWKNEGIRGMQRGLFPAVSGSSTYLLGILPYFLSQYAYQVSVDHLGTNRSLTISSDTTKRFKTRLVSS
jgi:Mitochondrial carrier protein